MSQEGKMEDNSLLDLRTSEIVGDTGLWSEYENDKYSTGIFKRRKDVRRQEVLSSQRGGEVRGRQGQWAESMDSGSDAVFRMSERAFPEPCSLKQPHMS